MPFRGDRFFASTRQWDWSDVGLYVWALWEQWASGRSQVISAEVYEALPERVRAKFKAVRGGYRNDAARAEYARSVEAYDEVSRKNSANALKRWEKRRATASPPQSDRKATAVPNGTKRREENTTPKAVPAERKERPANPLVAGRRPALEAELLKHVSTIAEREKRDPTEVVADLSRYEGRSVVNPASMSDDRLVQTLNAARKRAGNGSHERPAVTDGEARAYWIMNLRPKGEKRGPTDEEVEQARQELEDLRQGRDPEPAARGARL